VQQHHRDAIERWAEAAAVDDEVLAVVVAGSLTNGYGLANSDVDGFLIVTDERSLAGQQPQLVAIPRRFSDSSATLACPRGPARWHPVPAYGSHIAALHAETRFR
jgi:hypothetical protein